jgi:outer membrane immunogenic protein
MKKQLLCGVAVGALSVVGEAAYAQAPAAVVLPSGFLWNGLYAGVHIGWGQARFTGTWFGDSGNTDFTHRADGLLGGFQIGQNWQQNTFVYGWEADLTLMNMTKSSRFSDVPGSGDALTTKLNVLSSLRGRLGVTVTPATLLYFTGGLAYAHGKVEGNDGGTGMSASFNKFGGVIGGGIEVAQSPAWRWRVESLYYLLNGSVSVSGPSDSARARLDNVWVVRIGLNHPFGGP